MKKAVCATLALLLLLCAAGCGEQEKWPELDLGQLDQTPEVMSLAGEGWSFEYDPELFGLTGAMTVAYTGADSPMPVYLAAQVFSGDTAADIAEGLRLQSGLDGVTVEDSHVGQGQTAAKYVYIERVVGEISEVTQYQRFYAVDIPGGCLLLEAGSYDGAPAAAREGLAAMLDSFTLE